METCLVSTVYAETDAKNAVEPFRPWR